MNQPKFIIAITGPAGSGKTTVSELLAKRLGQCANIDADSIKHMIPDGFYRDDANPGGWSYNRWELMGDSIGLLAHNFSENGYHVIINGYIAAPAWEHIHKHVQPTHRFLLLPDASTAIVRDGGRAADIQMGAEAVRAHHEHFSTDPHYASFTKIDSSQQSADETAHVIEQELIA